MSLLLDALKQAEKNRADKNESAESEQQPPAAGADPEAEPGNLIDIGEPGEPATVAERLPDAATAAPHPGSAGTAVDARPAPRNGGTGARWEPNAQVRLALIAGLFLLLCILIFSLYRFLNVDQNTLLVSTGVLPPEAIVQPVASLPATLSVAPPLPLQASAPRPLPPETPVTQSANPKVENVTVVADAINGAAAPVNSNDRYVDLPRAVAVTFRKKTVPDPYRTRLETARRAFEQGDWSVAKDLYRELAHLQPDNPQPRYGLAAIALREGDLATARTHYQGLLQQNPQDPYALAGLRRIQSDTAPGDEARLKRQLDEQPQSAFLHYELGNLLAGQKRWPEAQQAYFQALSLAADNPIYAYNLAVSLEHLGQSNAALDHYRKALQQSAAGHPLDQGLIRERIAQLEKTH